MSKAPALLPLALGLLLPAPGLAQDHSGHDMAGMDMPRDANQPVGTHEHPLPGRTAECPDASWDDCDYAIHLPPAAGSGTSRLPGAEGGMHGLHLMAGEWMVMIHGAVSGQYSSFSGPRGESMAYATSMAMASAERGTDWGKVTLKGMFSAEPAMSARGYPSLFTTGETAGGVSLVDRQHPHNAFMELAARVDVNAGPGSLFLYGGPVGEPALGPSAFMMRGSARYNPDPPISHHWFDSTHITFGVVTAGYATQHWQLEASAFRGAEPGEGRWSIEAPKLDSWSLRATLTPTPHWALQASYGQMHQPEAAHAGEDEHRFTASAHYASGALSAMAGFSAKTRVPGETLTAWLGEVNWNLSAHDTLFGRVENVANDELFPDHASPLHDQTFRVTKLQAGYARRIPLHPFELALGASGAAYAKPAVLDAFYGRSPLGYTLFVKLLLGH